MNKDKFIALSVPNLKGNELKYVSNAITTEWVSSVGQYVNQFESNVKTYVGSKNAISCQNGTSGLHLALLALGVDEKQEVLVPTLTFIAAVNPVKYVGADTIFMDCDDSLCIDPFKLEKFLENECEIANNKTINKKSGKHISTLIVVHVFGNIADMEKICEITNKYNISIIEDATEALGSKYISGPLKEKYAGTIGDIGVYSFNGNKIITTGGGGMIVTNDDILANKMKHLSTQAKSNELYFYHDEIGYNYRMTNVQAAMGIAQLEQLEIFIETKKNNYLLYKKEFKKEEKFDLLGFRGDIRPNYWFYSLFGVRKKINIDKFIKSMSDLNTQVRPIWGLIHEQIPYIDSQTYNITKAYEYIDKIINVPCSSNLSKEDVRLVIDRINSLKE